MGIKIDKSKLRKQSSKKETYYEYCDKELGPLKVIITELFDEKEKPVGIVGFKVLRDNYSLPELADTVYNIHWGDSQ